DLGAGEADVIAQRLGQRPAVLDFETARGAVDGHADGRPRRRRGSRSGAGCRTAGGRLRAERGRCGSRGQRGAGALEKSPPRDPAFGHVTLTVAARRFGRAIVGNGRAAGQTIPRNVNVRIILAPAPMDRAFLAALRRIVGDGNVLDDALELLTYECDALPPLRESPAAVALPGSAAEVQEVVRLCARDRVPFVARGHGTGLSGGALPVAGGLVIALSRLNRVVSVDIPNQ